jgi:hypothetical protein
MQSRCYDSIVHRELLFTQPFRNILHQLALLIFCGVLFTFPLHAETQKASLPDPIKFINKFDIVANVAHAVLDDMGFSIELDDRKTGKITTRPLEFISGSLTPGEIEKYAAKNDISSDNFLKAQYSVEAILEIVSPTETLVTIQTKIEALNRNVDGTEKWIPLESLGTFERRILGKISIKLMGNEAPLYQRKGFWSQKPKPVDPRQQRYQTPSR